MMGSVRRAHAPLLLLFLLAAYGSLYPFRFALPPSFEMALAELMLQRQWWTTRGDVGGNVLLFVPIGVALVYATASGGYVLLRRTLYVIATAGFALLLQIAQIFVPARTAALSDVLWNCVGVLLGMLLAQFVLSRLPRWSLQGDRQTHVVLLVIACWLGWRLWPFEPALSIPQVYRTLKPLLLLQPLNAWSAAGAAVSLLLIATMVDGLRHPRRWLLGVAAVGLAVRFVLAGQAISTSVFAGTLIGVLAGLHAQRMGIVRSAPWVMAIAALWYSAESLRPFMFSAQQAPINWVPFAATLRGAMDINLAAISGVAFLSGALMLIGTRWRGTAGRWCVLLAAWILLLELAQQWIPTRTSDATVALLPFGWWLVLKSSDTRPACGAPQPGA